jgi:DNA-binding XRE family transcriptional regulator
MSNTEHAGEKPASKKTAPDSRHSATVKRIRTMLGRTQSELANALGISEKAVQSYEQGWRTVPARVMIQLLVLLALYRKQTLDDIPCWEIRECASEQREQCASFTVGRGQFCWFIGTKDCRPPASKTSDTILPCMDCPVIQRLLTGRREDTAV